MSNPSLRLLSWNVNGIRAIHRKGFADWFTAVAPDVLCLQETKAQPEQVPKELQAVAGYHVFWASAERKGYSGVATYTRVAPEAVHPLGIEEFDVEGRVQILEFPEFVLFNCYFPNSQEGGARIRYKVRFCDAVLARLEEFRHAGRPVLVCGDFNIAHTPIDLANPKGNEKNPGYLPEERAWMTKFLSAGYLDTFRLFCDQGGHYTWWTYRFKARERNVGWRIDYHCTNREFRDAIREAGILSDVMGSDHCPVSLTLCP